MEAIQALQKAEAQAAWNLYVQETVRELYFCADPPCAVLVLECEDLSTAKAILAELPLVKQALIDFDYYTLAPFRQFEVLFSS